LLIEGGIGACRTLHPSHCWPIDLNQDPLYQCRKDKTVNRRTMAVLFSGLLVVGVAFGQSPIRVAKAVCNNCWETVTSPNNGTDSNALKGVSSLSGGNTAAAGYYGSFSSSNTLTEYWNGTSWNLGTSQDPNSWNLLNAVS